MKLIELAHKVEKFSIDNSPTILTTIGVIGTISTAVLTHKAATRAEIIATDAMHDIRTGKADGPYSKKLHLKLVWKEYVPPIAAGAFTITAIVFANRIGSKRAAALAAAYTLSERGFQEYREKIVEKMGANKEQAARDEIAQQQVNARPVTDKQVIIAGSGEVLCFDQFSGRYFMSSMEKLKQAENATNFQVLHQGHASLSDFYERVGLPATTISEEVGWTTDKSLELEYSTTMSDDNRPCIAFSFYIMPVRDYFRYI